jgi:hypothetical protein
MDGTSTAIVIYRHVQLSQLHEAKIRRLRRRGRIAGKYIIDLG